MEMPVSAVIKQHLIDPESCIRCNTCESVCPSSASTHDGSNYVVDATKCNACLTCIGPCPTGAIDNWRTMPRAMAYSVEVQLGWDSLPDELPAADLAAPGITSGEEQEVAAVAPSQAASVAAKTDVSQYSATLPPWSAAHAYTKLYDIGNPVIATVTGNMRVTEVGREYDT